MHCCWSFLYLNVTLIVCATEPHCSILSLNSWNTLWFLWVATSDCDRWSSALSPLHCSMSTQHFSTPPVPAQWFLQACCLFCLFLLMMHCVLLHFLPLLYNLVPLLSHLKQTTLVFTLKPTKTSVFIGARLCLFWSTPEFISNFTPARLYWTGVVLVWEWPEGSN